MINIVSMNTSHEQGKKQILKQMVGKDKDNENGVVRHTMIHLKITFGIGRLTYKLALGSNVLLIQI
jgi:hypothetical protein